MRDEVERETLLLHVLVAHAASGSLDADAMEALRAELQASAAWVHGRSRRRAATRGRA